MKKPTSGIRIGAYIAAGLAGLYLLGAVWVYSEPSALRSEYHPKGPPNVLRNVAVFLYYPFFEFLNRHGWLP